MRKSKIIVLTIVLLICSNLTYSNVSASNEQTIRKDTADAIKVDIKGEVNNPGVYEMKQGSRTIDLVELAGGFTVLADSSSINLSKLLKDELVITIYSKEEQACICPMQNISNSNSIININTANVGELQNLSSIGESKARAIVKYREENGFFNNIEEIMNVTGIGESIFEKIKNNIKT